MVFLKGMTDTEDGINILPGLKNQTNPFFRIIQNNMDLFPCLCISYMGHNPGASWAKVAASTQENFIPFGRKGFLSGENDPPDSTECWGEPLKFLQCREALLPQIFQRWSAAAGGTWGMSSAWARVCWEGPLAKAVSINSCCNKQNLISNKHHHKGWVRKQWYPESIEEIVHHSSTYKVTDWDLLRIR